jgi:hypothetical protein
LEPEKAPTHVPDPTAQSKLALVGRSVFPFLTGTDFPTGIEFPTGIGGGCPGVVDDRLAIIEDDGAFPPLARRLHALSYRRRSPAAIGDLPPTALRAPQVAYLR